MEIHRTGFNSGWINHLPPEQSLSVEERYFSKLAEWAAEEPIEPDRRDVIGIVKNWIQEDQGKNRPLFIVSKRITKLPPFPPLLTSLVLHDCPITTVQDNRAQLTYLLIRVCPIVTITSENLTQLCIDSCDDFITLPDTLTQLTRLTIHNCANFETVHGNLPDLNFLLLTHCPRCRRLPNDLPNDVRIFGQFVYQRIQEEPKYSIPNQKIIQQGG